MSRNKKNYLKLSPDFFEREDIKGIQKLPDNGKILVLYFRLLSVATMSDGYIRYDRIGKTPVEEVALFLKEDKKDMEYAIEMLRRYHLLKEMENGDYYFPDAVKLMGYR